MAAERNKTVSHTVVGDTLRQAGHKLDELGEQAANKSDTLIHQGQEVVSNFQNELEEYSDVLVNYIKKYPLKSALIAGGIGLVLGRLLKS